MYGSLCVVSADNSASAACGGFKESTSAYRPCRQCMATRADMNTKFKPRDFDLRTVLSHSEQLDKLENADGEVQHAAVSKENGINCRSVLSSLKYFEVVGGYLTPDVMYDVLEGALQHEVKLLLQQFINHEHYFSLAQLNQSIEAFELGYSEVKDRPSIISQTTLNEKDGHMKQSGEEKN